MEETKKDQRSREQKDLSEEGSESLKLD